MTPFRWSAAKNRLLRHERSISFEQVVVAIEDVGLVDVRKATRDYLGRGEADGDD